MILYEFEGKKMLAEVGINVPKGQLLDSISGFAGSRMTIKGPLVLKAQVLSGKRADAGGIVVVDDFSTLDSRLWRGSPLATRLSALFKKTINGEKVEKVLVEEKVEYEKEYYVSISYDTDTRGPVLTISKEGGTGVEERSARSYPINVSDPTLVIPNVMRDLKIESRDSSASPQNDSFKDVLKKLIKLFFDQDCLLLEVNPLVVLDGELLALDAKIKLDDDAKKRHPEWSFPPRLVPGHTPTKNEIEAKKIDEGDYRGTAGSAYFDLDGDIAVLSSGGGVSLTAMDALIKNGGKPANFTEYSGNPSREKVTKLTKIVLSKPKLHGLWVIGTVAANFTDIYETLSGFIEGLREAQTQLNEQFKFPIVIRRGGPHEREAFEMLKSVKDFDLHLQGEETSITQSAMIMVQLAKKYKYSSR